MTDKSEEVEMTAEVADPAKALAEAQAQADKYLDMARRLQADFDNFRKRTPRTRSSASTPAPPSSGTS